MPRPPQAGDGRVPDTGAAAQERLRHVSLDLEEAKSAAGNEWQEVAGRALRNNVLCWGLPPAGCGVAAACMACSGCFSAQCVLAATAGTLAGGAAGLAYGNFVYCREAKASATAAYVDDIETLDRFKALVEDIRKARPVLRLGIVCRHLESSTDYDSNGESSTSSYWVETHRASQDFSGFAAVFDETLSADDMWALVAENHGRIVDDELLLVQMHINALPVSDASQEELRRHAQNWFDAERCDSEQLYSWSWELDTPGSFVWPSGGRMTLISGQSGSRRKGLIRRYAEAVPTATARSCLAMRARSTSRSTSTLACLARQQPTPLTCSSPCGMQCRRWHHFCRPCPPQCIAPPSR